MDKNYLIWDLIAQILEFGFVVVTIINLNNISHHLCCDMDRAVINIIVLFSLLEICILSRIIDDIICLVKLKRR